jgi:hypothetical protein
VQSFQKALFSEKRHQTTRSQSWRKDKMIHNKITKTAKIRDINSFVAFAALAVKFIKLPSAESSLNESNLVVVLQE